MDEQESLPLGHVGEKEIHEYRHRDTGFFSLRLSGGGKLPKELRGHYTSRKAMHDALVRYENRIAASAMTAAEEVDSLEVDSLLEPLVQAEIKKSNG